jgi:hypothetical protein
VHIFRQTSDMVQLLLMRIRVVMFSAANSGLWAHAWLTSCSGLRHPCFHFWWQDEINRTVCPLSCYLVLYKQVVCVTFVTEQRSGLVSPPASCPPFKSRPGDQLFWLRMYVVLLTPSRHMPRYFFNSLKHEWAKEWMNERVRREHGAGISEGDYI